MTAQNTPSERDLVIVGDGLCLVRDLKFGKGVRVEAEDNSQLKLYGLGAIAAYHGRLPLGKRHQGPSLPRGGCRRLK